MASPIDDGQDRSEIEKTAVRHSVHTSEDILLIVLACFTNHTKLRTVTWLVYNAYFQFTHLNRLRVIVPADWTSDIHDNSLTCLTSLLHIQHPYSSLLFLPAPPPPPPPPPSLPRSFFFLPLLLFPIMHSTEANRLLSETKAAVGSICVRKKPNISILLNGVIHWYTPLTQSFGLNYRFEITVPVGWALNTNN